MEYGRYRTRRAAPSGDGTPHAPAHTSRAGSPNSSRLQQRWGALPPRLRRTLQALLADAAITDANARTALAATPATPTPTPWPARPPSRTPREAARRTRTTRAPPPSAAPPPCTTPTT
ncbi:hypothetical protein [Streptomyces sp. NBC_00134]|uniref:hypothetical protein n=1 Tax=Streptomyces sp. NBC_00134 TaxID=2975663 RepID=UPI00324B038C